MRHIRAYVERQEGSDGPLRVTAATEGVKADGIDLRMDRARLERWRSNPVVLLEHFPITLNAKMPAVIGRADDIDTDGDSLKADVTFDTGSDIGAEIDRQYRDGFLHAFSIGFDHGPLDRDGAPEWWEPVELSAVPVPMDSDALVEDGRQQVVTMARALTGDRDVVRTLREMAGITPGRTDGPVEGREALPAHSTATDTDSEWNGPQQIADAPNDPATLRYMHAWRDAEGDPAEKQAYKLPHHPAGTDTPAVINAVNNALARLSQTDIPASDRDEVEKHLRDHREDAGLDRGMSDAELRAAVNADSIVRAEPADWLFIQERQLRTTDDASHVARRHRQRRQHLRELTSDANPLSHAASE